MEGYSKEVFLDCLSDLTGNVKADDGLLDYLYSQRWVTPPEHQQIRNAAGDPFKQMSKLVEILSRKDDGALDAVIDFLQRQGGQSRIVNRLIEMRKQYARKGEGDERMLPEASTSTPTQMKDHKRSSLSSTGIEKVVDTLCNDGEVLKKWSTTAVPKILSREIDIHAARKTIEREDIHEGIRRTLHLWRSEKGRQATFGLLVEILKRNGFTSAAEKLEKLEQDEMQGVDFE